MFRWAIIGKERLLLRGRSSRKPSLSSRSSHQKVATIAFRVETSRMGARLTLSLVTITYLYRTMALFLSRPRSLKLLVAQGHLGPEPSIRVSRTTLHAPYRPGLPPETESLVEGSRFLA